MGAYISSPQLEGGLLYAGPNMRWYGPIHNTSGPYTSAFTVGPSDTNSFGFAATMISMTGNIHAQYTDTAGIVKSATCSTRVNSYTSLTYVYYTKDAYGTYQPLTTTEAYTSTAYGSVLCPIANTQIGTGPLIFSLSGDPDPGTLAMYFGRTTATISPEPTTTTIVVPGRTTYMATKTSTVFATTETVARSTTTLTGQYPASRCSSLQTSSPTTLSTSRRSSSSSSSSQSARKSSSSLSSSTGTSSSSARAVSSSSTKTSSTRTSSSSKTSSTSKTNSSSKFSSSSKKSSSSKSTSSKKSSSSKSTSSSKTSSIISKSSSSKTTSSSTTLKATSKSSTKPVTKTTSSKVISKSTSSRRTSSSPVCSTGAELKSLSSYPAVASRLCQEILSTKLAFPSSISVWPASQLSSACSCYGKASPTKIGTPAKNSLHKRVTFTEEVQSSSTATSSGASSSSAIFGNSSSIVSSSTSTAPTTVLGYGPPTIYSVPTITINTTRTVTVYMTNNLTTFPTTTTTISSGTTTVTKNSTVTIDKRTSPTTCISNFADKKITLSERSLTCTNLKLHTAFLWVMMKNPFDFCAYYLTANRNASPLPEMSPSTLEDTCSCLITHKSAPLPVFKVGSSYSPKPKRECNMSVASLIKAKFKEPESFCKYYTSTSRRISPFAMLKPGDLFAGCSCLV